MKYIILLILSCVLFIAYGCKKDTAEYMVVFTKDTTIVNNCGCDAEFIKFIYDKETRVVFDTDSTFWRQDLIDAIVYDNDSALFTSISKHYNMIGYGRICNSQDLIPYFDIPSDKEYKVKISGKEFESCNPVIGPAIYTQADFLVTELKLLN